MGVKIEDLLKEATIGGLERPAAVECGKDTTVAEAIRLMQNRASGYVVISDKNKVIGIFTEKDVTLSIVNIEKKLDVPIINFIKKPLITLTLGDSVGRAVHLMHTYEYRHIALVDEKGELAGVLSARGIIRFLAENFPAEVLNLPPRTDQISVTREGG